MIPLIAQDDQSVVCRLLLSHDCSSELIFGQGQARRLADDFDTLATRLTLSRNAAGFLIGHDNPGPRP
jgi:hypothetical protein